MGKMGRKLVDAGMESPLDAAVSQRDRGTIAMVRQSLERGDAVLAYQPVMRADGAGVAFYEGLIRILDETGRDLIPRRTGVWTPHEIGARMIESLTAAGRPVPGYLQDAVDELAPRRARTLTFAMHCFWTGEVALGGPTPSLRVYSRRSDGGAP